MYNLTLHSSAPKCLEIVSGWLSRRALKVLPPATLLGRPTLTPSCPGVSGPEFSTAVHGTIARVPLPLSSHIQSIATPVDPTASVSRIKFFLSVRVVPVHSGSHDLLGLLQKPPALLSVLLLAFFPFILSTKTGTSFPNLSSDDIIIAPSHCSLARPNVLNLVPKAGPRLAPGRPCSPFSHHLLHLSGALIAACSSPAGFLGRPSICSLR